MKPWVPHTYCGIFKTDDIFIITTLLQDQLLDPAWKQSVDKRNAVLVQRTIQVKMVVRVPWDLPKLGISRISGCGAFKALPSVRPLYIVKPPHFHGS
ncbi:hypothetical protein NPIL_273191 [Nephila pilipes]|uniref:Uncharacterized protein n=1 Tax=Nephila pilipes TaxID=299642 RepID=A0A8X6PXF6_NEPPI|nr:hypothetical protein NPIL_273191 [Nephila pilipes]